MGTPKRRMPTNEHPERAPRRVPTRRMPRSRRGNGHPEAHGHRVHVARWGEAVCREVKRGTPGEHPEADEAMGHPSTPERVAGERDEPTKIREPGAGTRWRGSAKSRHAKRRHAKRRHVKRRYAERPHAKRPHAERPYAERPWCRSGVVQHPKADEAMGHPGRAPWSEWPANERSRRAKSRVRSGVVPKRRSAAAA